MSTPEKAPESLKSTPSSKPTEGGVSADAIREGQLRQVDQRLASLDDKTRQRAVDAITTATNTTSTTSTEDNNSSGLLGAVSGASSIWEELVKVLGDAGTKISDFLKNLFDFKDDGKEGTASLSTKPTASVPSSGTPEKMVEDSEMLRPGSPVFSFGKDFARELYASDVPRIRPVHPVTGEKNVPHEGVDIPAPLGSPLYATCSMTILKTSNHGASGLRVDAKLDNGTVVSFLHLSKAASFTVGQKYPRGTWIGNTGNSGRSSGPHLHFEVDYGESDPIPYLDAELVASAEKKIEQKKAAGEWKALESEQGEHGFA